MNGCSIGGWSYLYRPYLGLIVKRGDIIATIWKKIVLHGERQFVEFGKYHIAHIISSFI